MRIAAFFLLSGFLVIGLVACNSNETIVKLPKAPAGTPATQPQPVQNATDSARRITAQELNAAWTQGKVLVVDTRNEPAFKQEHIKGAILIPSNEFASRAGELPLDKMIVTYCT